MQLNLFHYYCIVLSVFPILTTSKTLKEEIGSSIYNAYLIKNNVIFIGQLRRHIWKPSFREKMKKICQNNCQSGLGLLNLDILFMYISTVDISSPASSLLGRMWGVVLCIVGGLSTILGPYTLEANSEPLVMIPSNDFKCYQTSWRQNHTWPRSRYSQQGLSIAQFLTS